METVFRQNRQDGSNPAADPTIEEKVAFLSTPCAFAPGTRSVTSRETHMSWIFLAGNRVYKLKKPVHLPYLDFSTLERREAACRAELMLNRRLAPGIYLDVVPLRMAGTLSLSGDGRVVDWLVVMRRLEEESSLEQSILSAQAEPRQIDSLAGLLTRFYRHSRSARRSASQHLATWHRSLSDNRRVLTKAEFALPHGQLHRIDLAQHRFLVQEACLLSRRVQDHRIVDGHGDLRPEHIWLDHPGPIIDCLEFNPHLRKVDPFDEIAYLSVECERLGASWIGERMKRRLARALHDPIPDVLFAFYRCYRASLRARLSIAHLLAPKPRTPEKWRSLAKTYLAIAEGAAQQIETDLNSRANRRAARRR